MVEIAEGVRYIFSNPLVLSLTGAVGMVNFLGFGFLDLLSDWATDQLHGDVTTNSLLISARGFGASISALSRLLSGGNRSVEIVNDRLPDHGGCALNFSMGGLEPAFLGNPGNHRLEHGVDDQ